MGRCRVVDIPQLYIGPEPDSSIGAEEMQVHCKKLFGGCDVKWADGASIPSSGSLGTPKAFRNSRQDRWYEQAGRDLLPSEVLIQTNSLLFKTI